MYILFQFTYYFARLGIQSTLEYFIVLILYVVSYYAHDFYVIIRILCVLSICVSSFSKAPVFVHSFSKPIVFLQKTVFGANTSPGNPVPIRMGWYSLVWITFTPFWWLWSEDWPSCFRLLWFLSRLDVYLSVCIRQYSFYFIINGVLNIRLVYLKRNYITQQIKLQFLLMCIFIVKS